MSELTQKLHALNMEKEPIVRELRARIGELEKEIAPFRDPYFKGLSMEAVAELAKKSIKLTEQHNKDAARIGELEEALKVIANDDYTRPKMELLAREALKGAGK